jgi:hypothetical protein
MSAGRSLAASTAENHDLAGTLADDLQNAVVFTEIKGILVYAAAANGGVIRVGGHATAALAGLFASATDIIDVQPGGFFAWATPDATGAGTVQTTGDLLKVENMNGAAAGVYDILIIGS